MQKMSGPQLDSYRVLFLVATAALFIGAMAIEAIVIRGDFNNDFWYHWAFWLISPLGAVCAILWFSLAGCRREAGAQNGSSFEGPIHRLFDQALPLLLIFVWCMLMHAWADRTWPAPPLRGRTLGFAVGAPLAAAALWARFGIGDAMPLMRKISDKLPRGRSRSQPPD